MHSHAGAWEREKKLSIDYRARSTDQSTRREISPQNLAYYRDNWYVDAWCHLRDDMRMFAVDRIEQAEIIDRLAITISEELNLVPTLPRGNAYLPRH